MLQAETAPAVLDVENILAAHAGTQAFANALGRVSSSHELVRALSRYISFNSVFGSGVANLAGEIGARVDLFRDAREEFEVAADRSTVVAAAIFMAAIDEFGDRALASRSTHRALAQATLKGTLDYFGYRASTASQILGPDASADRALRRVASGYGLNKCIDDQGLLRAIGFHIASELLADEEFRILDRVLRSFYADLVQHLETSSVAVNGSHCAGYHWIRIHTTVEAEHCAAAWDAAHLALHYYAGPRERAEVAGWIIDGFAEFCAVQTEFMEGF